MKLKMLRTNVSLKLYFIASAYFIGWSVLAVNWKRMQ